MTCCICARAERRNGLLCEDCRDALIGPIAITGEQIQGVIGVPSSAALIDVWGGLHRLSTDTLVGRAQHEDVLSIYEPSVSRRHAWIAQEADVWTVRDLGSANGTFVGDRPAREPLSVAHGDMIRFGFVSFYFLADTTDLAVPANLDTIGQTEKPGLPINLDRTGPIVLPPRLRDVPIRLSEPSGGGGGVLQIEGRSAHLTLAQYELVTRLISRMVEDIDRPPDGRGYISSDQLATVLSLESIQPSDDNVRQLVRRVRRRLLEAGIGDIIESKYGLGYRLNITPRLV